MAVPIGHGSILICLNCHFRRFTCIFLNFSIFELRVMVLKLMRCNGVASWQKLINSFINWSQELSHVMKVIYFVLLSRSITGPSFRFIPYMETDLQKGALHQKLMLNWLALFVLKIWTVSPGLFFTSWRSYNTYLKWK